MVTDIIFNVDYHVSGMASQIECLVNNLFNLTTKKAWKLRITVIYNLLPIHQWSLDSNHRGPVSKSNKHVYSIQLCGYVKQRFNSILIEWEMHSTGGLCKWANKIFFNSLGSN